MLLEIGVVVDLEMVGRVDVPVEVVVVDPVLAEVGDKRRLRSRCAGTDVWMNETNPLVCQASVVPASLGDATLTVCGQPLWSNLSASLSIALA